MECMDASQDNGFGSFASGGVGSGVPISSGVSMDGNDIVLAGNNSASGDSKKKRIALVLGAFGVVAVLIGIVVAVVLRGGMREDIKKSFNQYANYLLYGREDSSDVDGTYYYGDNYYLDRIDDMDMTKEYFSVALEKIDKLIAAYQSEMKIVSKETVDGEDGLGNQESLLEELQNNKDNLSFFALLNEYPILNDNELISNVLTKKDEELNSYIQSYYSPFFESGNTTVMIFAEKQINTLENAIKAIRYYNDNGCIIEGGGQYNIDGSCSSMSEKYRESNKLMGDYYQMQLSNVALNQMYSFYVYGGIWDIKERIYEEKSS